MKALAVPADAPIVVGRTYLVTCVRMRGNAGSWGKRLWWPVRGAEHDDAYLGFPARHFHVDFRFLPERQYRRFIGRVFPQDPARPGALSPEEIVQGRVIQVSTREGESYGYDVRVRPMPAVRAGVDFPNGVSIAKKLRAAYEDVRLKDGLVCPHKGAPLLPTADAEGFSVCPLHGLCWNLREMRLATIEEETFARLRRKAGGK